MKDFFRRIFAINWVLAGEHFVLRVGSFAFSLVSAHAILWFYNTLADVQNSDQLQRYVPYVIAGGFGMLGYFVSRGLVYRMLHKEPIRFYIAIVALFEFVEVVCNFAQAIGSVPNVAWLTKIEGWPHNTLVGLLYATYSIVPVVTFVLAVVDMDMEKEKRGAARPVAAGRPGMPGAPGAPVAPRPNVPPGVRPGQVPQPTQKALSLPQAPQKPVPITPVTPSTAASTGWKFPFANKSQNGTSQANGHVPQDGFTVIE